MNSNIVRYILKVWFTSGILCPIVLMLLLSILPSYHVPDMIGLICITYIFPCTSLLSVINVIAIAIALVGVSKKPLKEINIKLILSVISVLATYVTILIVYYLRFFYYLDTGVDYILMISYIISIIPALFFYRLKLRTNHLVAD
jgi:hypothetical protein